MLLYQHIKIRLLILHFMLNLMPNLYLNYNLIVHSYVSRYELENWSYVHIKFDHIFGV